MVKKENKIIHSAIRAAAITIYAPISFYVLLLTNLSGKQ